MADEPEVVDTTVTDDGEDAALDLMAADFDDAPARPEPTPEPVAEVEPTVTDEAEAEPAEPAPDEPAKGHSFDAGLQKVQRELAEERRTRGELQAKMDLLIEMQGKGKAEPAEPKAKDPFDGYEDDDAVSFADLKKVAANQSTDSEVKAELATIKAQLQLQADKNQFASEFAGVDYDKATAKGWELADEHLAGMSDEQKAPAARAFGREYAKQLAAHSKAKPSPLRPSPAATPEPTKPSKKPEGSTKGTKLVDNGVQTDANSELDDDALEEQYLEAMFEELGDR